MTNEEWIKSLSTEETAKFLIKAIMFFEMDETLSMSMALEKAMRTDENLNMFLMKEVLAWLRMVQK